MNWLQFLLWITGIYTIYYLGMIFFDSLKAGRIPVDKDLVPELVFEESVESVSLEYLVTAEAEEGSGSGHTVGMKQKREPAMVSSGGVSLKDLFELARTEAIIYTRAVSH